MKALFAIALVAAMTTAHAGINDPISLGNGKSITPVAGTARYYRNDRGYMQADMLVQFNNARTGSGERVRFGVTGCGDTQGLIFEMSDYTGQPTGEFQFTWAAKGDRNYDSIAWIVCMNAGGQH